VRTHTADYKIRDRRRSSANRANMRGAINGSPSRRSAGRSKVRLTPRSRACNGRPTTQMLTSRDNRTPNPAADRAA